MRVQSDELARTVRVVLNDEVEELHPEEARVIADRLAGAADSAEGPASDFAGVVRDDQTSLDDLDGDPVETLAEMYERREEADRDRPEFGEVRNDRDPMKW